MQEDYNKLTTLSDSKFHQVKSSDSLKPVFIFWDMMPFNHHNTSSKTINILQKCLRNSKVRKTRDMGFETTAKNLKSSEPAVSTTVERTTDLPSFPINRLPTHTSNLPAFLHEAENNQELCSTRFSSFKYYYISLLTETQIGEMKNYKDTVKDIFMNSTFDYSSNENYRKRLEQEKINPTERDIKIAKQIKEIALNFPTYYDISEALEYIYIEQLATRYQDIRRIKMEYSPMREYCYWYIDIFDEEDKLTLEALGLIKGSLPASDQANGLFDRLGNSYYSLNKNYKETVIPTLNNVEDYLFRNITKKKLHRLLELSSFTMGRENVLEYNQDLNQNVKHFIEQVKFIDENIASAYGKITQLKIPILTTYNVKELIMLQLAKDIKDEQIQN